VVNKEIVRRRLDQLAEHLEILGRYRSYSLKEFLAEPERYGSAERFLELTVSHRIVGKSGSPLHP
jgi:hypothetical protein